MQICYLVAVRAFWCLESVMSVPHVPSDHRGTAHFTKETRIRAYQCYFDAYFEIYHVSLDHFQLAPLLTGWRGDPVISKAYASFMAVGTVDGVVIGGQRGCTRRTYVKLLHRYWPEYAATRSCPPPTRRNAINLTIAEGNQSMSSLVCNQRQQW